MKINKKSLIIAILSALIVVSGCANPSAATTPTEQQSVSQLSVDASLPTIQDIATKTEYSGRVMPDNAAFIIPKVQGEVISVNFKPGDTVTKGDVLFEIDSTIARLQLDQAAAGLSAAKAGLQQATGATYEQQVLQAETALKQAQSAEKWTDQSDDEFEESYRDGEDSLEDAVDAAEGMASMAKVALDNAKTDLDNFVAANPNVPSWSELDSTEQEYIDNEAAIKEYLSLVNKYNSAQSAYTTAISNVSKAEQSLEQYEDGYEAQRDQFKQATEQTQISVNSAEKAYDLATGEAHAEQVASVEAQVAQAEAGYNLSLEQLSYYKVTSPITGTVEQVNVEELGMATQQSAAFVVSGDDGVSITFSVSASAAASLKEGDIVEIESSSNVYEAAITEVSTMIDQTSGLFKVKALIPSNPEELLSGVSVKVTAMTDVSEETITIPSTAVYYDDGEPFVFIVEGEFAKMTPVEVGIIGDEFTEITSGITSSTQVITSWSAKLIDGVAVVIAEV